MIGLPLGLALLGTCAAVALALLGARTAAFPPPGTRVAMSTRIEIYASSVAMLLVLALVWNAQTVGSGGSPSRQATEAAR